MASILLMLGCFALVVIAQLYLHGTAKRRIFALGTLGFGRGRKQHWFAFHFSLLLFVAGSSFAQTVPPDKERYILRFPDNRSHLERLLNRFDLTLEEVGPAYALVVGVDTYPRLPKGHRTLDPAKVDIENLVAYLQDQERFFEIVVLRNAAVTLDNLEYFLHRYFPEKLAGFPHSRFLFAVSGHGVEEGELGYLLKPNASEMSADHGISLNTVKGLYDRILHHAHQSLVLINACHSGAFLRRQAFGHRLVPVDSGHWAITAGGNAREVVWHDREVGPGSIFFEKFFAAMEGRADRLPLQPDGTSGDGIITVDELFTYLKTEVQLVTNQSQNPRLGNISHHGDFGSFFFFDRQRLRTAFNPRWDPTRARKFGEGPCAPESDCLSKDRSGQTRHELSEADSYDEVEGVQQVSAVSAGLDRPMCDGHDAKSCTDLGTMYAEGIGVERDEAQAAELFRQACDGGDPQGCTYLGSLYEYGRGVKRDKTRAAELFRQACDGGDAEGCTKLGQATYLPSGGITKDYARAADLFRRGCEGGNLHGCSLLAFLYRVGWGVPRDVARATELARQACDGGDSFGCRELERIISPSPSPPSSPFRKPKP